MLLNVQADKEIKLFLAFIFTLLKNNGTLYTVKYLKQMRLHVTRYMCGKPLYKNDMRISLTKGFPTKILYLKRFIDSGKTSEIRFCLTLLCISRAIKPKKGEDIPVSYDTITAKSKAKRDYTIPAWFMKWFVMYYKLSPAKPSYTFSDLYLSNKQGPAGPSTSTALYSFKYYSIELVERMLSLLGPNSMVQEM